MIRTILCEECDKRSRPQHPGDVALGWKRRRVQIRAKKPPVHEIRLITALETTTTHLASLHCDNCNTPLADGTVAFAHTDWLESREGEPGPWEQEFSGP
jgi:hypothetical protein